ncbi:MAG: DegT/DnrJ/EryC1/StrS family aminotransferase [Rhodospirillales bacterium]
MTIKQVKDSVAVMDEHKINIAEPLIGAEEEQAVLHVLRSGWLTQGSVVGEFERIFAGIHDVKHAVATTSCTTALHLALTAMGIGPGDEVIVPAFTWVATANVVRQCGATPVFIDVMSDTYNIDTEKVPALLTERTRAIIPVHLFGLCADMDALKSLLPDHVLILEDAACAVGAKYKGKSAGSLGDAAAFSFHPRKMVTCGEGGMVTTDDDILAHKMRVLRNHGASIPEETRHLSARPYDMPEFHECGFNYRLTDIQAAIAIPQLRKLDALLDFRRTIAAQYQRLLADIEWFRTPFIPNYAEHCWQAYVGVIDRDIAPCRRDDILEILNENGISARCGTHAIPELDAYATDNKAICPVSAELSQMSIALPMHNAMRNSDVDRIVRVLQKI